jgi:DNA polymerase-1
MYSDYIYTLEKDLLRRLIVIESNGTLLDVDYLHKLEKEFSEKIEAMCKKYPDMNINSPSQIGHRLFNVEGITPIKKTATGGFSADDSVLKEIAATIGSAFAKDMLEYKFLSHTYSTYIRAFLDKMDSQHRIHCNFKQLGARTGRLSCVDPNLQQVPKFTPLIRQAFIGTDNLCTFDYSQMEAVLYVLQRQEPYLVEALNSGRDIYQTISAKLYGKKFDDVTKEERDDAKGIVLGILYGMGQKKFGSMTSGMKLANVREFFKELKLFNEEIGEQIQNTGYVETEYGRRRHLSVEEAYKGINARIQGTAADIVKLSIIALPRELLNKFRITVHDENIFENLTMDELMEVKKIMTQFKDKLKVKAGMGKNWWEASSNEVK